ncbi:MAG: hypothetical protein E4G91_03110 [Candidatus Zixiibacteriota bacterium]|nr:MAG: hypothetical protein E4G91_03110 [candidate division Zixibacteria bacterium]
MKTFLDGSLAPVQSDLIREHIDCCASCAAELVEETRLGTVPLEDVSAPHDFADKLLLHFPEPTVSTILFKYLCGTFALSVMVGVSIFALWRRVAQPGRPLLAELRWDSLSSLESSFPWLQQITGSPIFNYMMLALLATLLTVVLIVIVDHPRGRHTVPASRLGRIHSL